MGIKNACQGSFAAIAGRLTTTSIKGTDVTVPKRTKKPDKPHPAYPLYPHGSGQWAKKVRGKVIYCGPWADPDAALNHWLRVKDEAIAGRPVSDDSCLRLKQLCNLFLDSKDARVKLGKMTPRSFKDYENACTYMVGFLGGAIPAESLKPADFTRMRLAFPETWSLRTQRNMINTLKTVFNWAYKEDYIDRPVKFGENFAVTLKEESTSTADSPAKLFTRAELKALHTAASTPLKAMLLLGLNAAYGNIDCSRLCQKDVQGEWLRVPRGKTTEPRRAWLWPETREAIRLAMEARPTPKPDHAELVFVTEAGVPFVDRDTKRCNVGKHWRRAKKTVGLERENSGFYAIRHTFATQSEEVSKDFPAIRFVMGHRDSTMSGTYRESISDQRVRDVCESVRDWWLAGDAKGSEVAE
ncbi:tyrosine-type recombinase/integrase [Rosistilla oblonga]|uniref:tyrosine-type recombinase/integrase n=1 Tax=Rosistilla oblonga TaxID=2527990 RepID=UPI003A9714A0